VPLKNDLQGSQHWVASDNELHCIIAGVALTQISFIAKRKDNLFYLLSTECCDRILFSNKSHNTRAILHHSVEQRREKVS